MAKRIREKTAKILAEKDNRPFAKVTHVRVSPTKAIPVVNLVRGKSYDEAIAILENLPNDAASIVLKLINSAASNAEHNKGLNRHDLYVAEIFVDNAPFTENRYWFKGHGRGSRIASRRSHITVKLDMAKGV